MMSQTGMADLTRLDEGYGISTAHFKRPEAAYDDQR